MSYQIDPTTLLFDDLSYREAQALEALVHDCVFLGKASLDAEPFLAWCKVAKQTPSLLVFGTAFPQRALFSLLSFYRET